MTDTSQPASGNPPAQTPTGEIKDQTTTPLTETKTDPKPEAKVEETLLNKKDETKPSGAPEKYADFTVPKDLADKGFELDPAAVAEVLPTFKELGLSQEGAQKLMEAYAKVSMKNADAAVNSVVEMRKDWQTKSMTQFGADKLKPGGAIHVAISKTLDSLGPELSAQFREAMDLTGAGDHPAFIAAMKAFSERFIEGTHVGGNGPSKESQSRPGSGIPSPAKAMYPNLA